MKVAYRPARPEDREFVIGSWVAAFRDSDRAGQIAHADWFDVMWPQIAKVLDRPDSTAIVAYEATDPAFVYGHIVGDATERVPVVHFVFVKGPYKRLGIGRGLFAALGVDPARPFRYTHPTFWVGKLSHKIPMARRDDEFARRPKRPPPRSTPWPPTR